MWRDTRAHEHGHDSRDRAPAMVFYRRHRQLARSARASRKRSQISGRTLTAAPIKARSGNAGGVWRTGRSPILGLLHESGIQAQLQRVSNIMTSNDHARTNGALVANHRRGRRRLSVLSGLKIAKRFRVAMESSVSACAARSSSRVHVCYCPPTCSFRLKWVE